MNNLIPHDDPGGTSNTAVKINRQDAQFHSQCSQALLTIAKTCDTAHDLLWPYLFEFLCMESYSPVLGEICKCLKILIVRRKEVEPEFEVIINTDENRKPKIENSRERYFIFSQATGTTSSVCSSLRLLKRSDSEFSSPPKSHRDNEFNQRVE